MKRMMWVLGGALAAGLLGGCDEFGGGGGGGGAELNFQSGYVFVRAGDTGDDIFIANEDDIDNAVALTEDGEGNQQPSLSANGSQVVFVKKLSTTSWAIAAALSSGEGEARTLYENTATQSNLRLPTFSPDGSRIAFAYTEAGASHVATIDAVNGGDFEIVATGDESTSFDSPSYIDGDNLLVARGSSPASMIMLEVRNLTTLQATKTIELGPLGLSRLANRAVAQLSPGSNAVLDGVSATNKRNIYVVNLTGTAALRQVTKAAASDPDAMALFPSWSGISSISFSSNAGGSDQLYEVAATATSTDSWTLVMPSAREAWWGSTQ